MDLSSCGIARFCTDAADHSRVAHGDVRPPLRAMVVKLDWMKALVIGFFNIHAFGPTAMPQQQ